MSKMPFETSQAPLTVEKRAHLLAKVYAIILSPEWEKETERPSLTEQPIDNQEQTQ